MKTIRVNGYAFFVDTEKTERYYKTHSLCDCVCCRNYYAQIKNRFPEFDRLLNAFGADISRPDEVTSIEMDGYTDYMSADYTVCGRMEPSGQCKIDQYDDLPLNLVITDGFVSPNEQTGEYFTISVMKLELPWALEETFPEPITERAVRTLKFKNVFRKLFKK